MRLRIRLRGRDRGKLRRWSWRRSRESLLSQDLISQRLRDQSLRWRRSTLMRTSKWWILIQNIQRLQLLLQPSTRQSPKSILQELTSNPIKRQKMTFQWEWQSSTINTHQDKAFLMRNQLMSSCSLCLQILMRIILFTLVLSLNNLSSLSTIT